MSKNKINPTHRNIFTGKEVELINKTHEGVTYRIEEPIEVNNLYIREFTKPEKTFNVCYEKLNQ